MFVGVLLSVAGCAEQVDTVESLTQRAIGWLLGEEGPEQATPAVQLLATPTLASGASATSTLPRVTREAEAAVPATAPPTATPPATAVATAAVSTARPADGPFAGEFAGTAYGDNDSTAPIALALTHRNGEVAGTVTIDEGLEVVAGGLCGTVPVPPTAFRTEAPLAAESRRLETTATIPVEGFEIEVALVATLSDDGQALTARATLFTPALCSRNPMIEATLARQ